MRKTQMALAAVALVASSAAMADVTLYGTLDVGVGSTKGARADGLDQSQGSKMHGDGGFSAGNNWGIKGSEDLGGGMTAGFTLQQGIDLNGNTANGRANSFGDGTTNLATRGGNVTFNQVAKVSLGSSEWGTVALGQQLTPFVAGIAGSMHGNGHFWVNRLIMSQPGAGDATGGGGNTGGFFIPNALSYASPSISGWSVNVLTTLRQGADQGVAGQPLAAVQNGYSAASVSGNVGEIGVTLVTHNRSEIYKSSGIGVTVPLMGLTIKGNYIRTNNDVVAAAAGAVNDADGKVGSWSLGASYPLTEATTVALQYASNDAKNAASDRGQSLIGAHIQHSLSKSTSLYALYTRGTGGANSDYSNRAAGGLGSLADGIYRTTYVAGVVHSF